MARRSGRTCVEPVASGRGTADDRARRSDEDATARTRRRSIALRLDGRAWLRVEPEVLLELEVAEGEEIDDERRAAVEEALARARARLFVVRSLAVRMQSRAEIETKLVARDVPPEIAREAIERAAGYGYIDDEVLAGQLARGMRARGYGRRRAEQKLRSRGLAGLLAAAALDRGVRRRRRDGARARGARAPTRRGRRGPPSRDRVSRPARLLVPRRVEGRARGRGRDRRGTAGERRVGSTRCRCQRTTPSPRA